MATQDEFIGRIRAALGRGSDERPRLPELSAPAPTAEDARLLERIRGRGPKERRQLLERMMAAAAPLHLQVVTVAGEREAAEALATLVRRTPPEWRKQRQAAAWRHPLLEAIGLEAAFAEAGLPLYVVGPAESAADRGRIRQNIVAAHIGITAADFALADTATLVMRTRPGRPRSAAVVPSVHAAVVRIDQLLADLKELCALLRWDEVQREAGLSNYLSMITGPSKTADIEATMVYGAHGPREVHVFVLDTGG